VEKETEGNFGEGSASMCELWVERKIAGTSQTIPFRYQNKEIQRTLGLPPYSDDYPL